MNKLASLRNIEMTQDTFLIFISLISFEVELHELNQLSLLVIGIN